jgi:glycosyltransferase involved in cell wall biosynthesis
MSALDGSTGSGYRHTVFDDTAVVMITRNEEGAIGKVVADVKRSAPGADVIVVDGSDDRTPDIARAGGATVIREPGGGPGPALHAALFATDRSIVVTLDADDTYPADMIPDLVWLVRSGFDVAGTTRISRGRPSTMPVPNFVANRAFNLIASVVYGVTILDVHSGMRAYRASMLRAETWDYEDLAFTVELLLRPVRRGFSVVEIPIPYRDRVGLTTLTPLSGTRATLRRIWTNWRLRGRPSMLARAVGGRGSGSGDNPASEATTASLRSGR